jgi:cell division protein FtsL
MKTEDIFTVNKVLYVVAVVALLVIALDLYHWRPHL